MQLSGFEERYKIHHLGLWHRNVQLNIKNKNKILLQQRSGIVDIAKNLYDQSLATHLLPGESEIDALKRAILEELGIKNLKFKKISKTMKIEKKYEYDQSLWNREFITLYETEYDRLPEIVCNRVKKVFWMDVKSFEEDVNKHSDKYTKTCTFWVKKGIT